MKIKMVKTVAMPGRLLEAGQVVEVTDVMGNRLIAEQSAEAVAQTPAAVDAGPVGDGE